MPSSLFEKNAPNTSIEARVFVRVAIERGYESSRAGSQRGNQAGHQSSDAGKRRSAQLRDWDAFTYAVPDALVSPEDPVLVGEHVTVPLGKGNTPTRGIVVEVGTRGLIEGIAPASLKSVLTRHHTRLPESLVELGCWLAEYYICPLGMALATLVPAAVKAGVGQRTVSLLTMAKDAPDRATLLPRLSKRVKEAYEALEKLDPDLLPMASADLAGALGMPTRREVNVLLKQGVLTTITRDIVKARDDVMLAQSPPRAEAPRLTLTAAQTQAIEGIGATLGSFATHLLFGVTGSGKTEVYLRLIERVLAADRTAIVLVPEIALTPQTSTRFAARFASQGVAVLHSGLTAAQRHREWKRAATGQAKVVVGARSAVFAPLKNLGLIIVDEEHDSSYKQDQLPRYNARDVAIVRARIEGCPAVLGSATPAIESWANATRTPARSALWKLPDRVGKAKMPTVEVVDMAAAFAPGQYNHPDRQSNLSPKLRGALKATLSRGEQAIILLNRRGYSSYLCCAKPSCSWALECDHCDARLVLHTGRNLPHGMLVRCHHCLAEQMIPARCPACQGKLLRLGTGTQRVEEELCRVFASGKVDPCCVLEENETLVRVDSDTMRTGRDYFDVLARFGRGEIRVLLGTQMIAKGLDYPNVSLVGVLCADAALAMPDFRAAERTFGLVSQVAGRAGRGTIPGLVIVQAYEPQAHAITLAARHEYETFAREELESRKQAQLPPASRMARIVCRHQDFTKAEQAAEALVQALQDANKQACKGRLEVLGPSPCVVSRIATFYRFEVILIAPSARLVQEAMAHARARGLLKSDARTAVDVDPLSLM